MVALLLPHAMASAWSERSGGLSWPAQELWASAADKLLAILLVTGTCGSSLQFDGFRTFEKTSHPHAVESFTGSIGSICRGHQGPVDFLELNVDRNASMERSTCSSWGFSRRCFAMETMTWRLWRLWLWTTGNRPCRSWWNTSPVSLCHCRGVPGICARWPRWCAIYQEKEHFKEREYREGQWTMTTKSPLLSFGDSPPQ